MLATTLTSLGTEHKLPAPCGHQPFIKTKQKLLNQFLLDQMGRRDIAPSTHSSSTLPQFPPSPATLNSVRQRIRLWARAGLQSFTGGGSAVVSSPFDSPRLALPGSPAVGRESLSTVLKE